MGLVSGPAIGSRPEGPGTGLAIADGALARRDLWGIAGPGDLIPQRHSQASPMPVVTDDTALRNSAVWACLRLRADLVSTFPVDVFRKARLADGSDISIPVPAPPVLTQPAGAGSLWPQWAFSSQWDLDRSGNAIGLIKERNGLGQPLVIELQDTGSCSARVKGNTITRWRIGGTEYAPEDVWHETQFTVGGFPLGLSPVAYSAWQTLSRFMSIEQFAIAWFAGGGVPRSRLRNSAKTLNAPEIAVVKEAWLASLATGEPFVHGSDWEYDLIQANEAGSNWLDAQRAGTIDIARFFGCPADLIDAAVQGGARITYANVAQRHLQLLILHIGPAVVRREAAFSQRLVQAPRFVKLNTKAMLRLDPLTQAQMLQTLINSRTLAPSEAREFDDRPPFTDAQVAEFDHFWPPKTAPAPANTPAGGPGAGGGTPGGGPDEPGASPGEP